MARTVIVGNTVQPLGPPNGGVSSEQGTNWNDTVVAINAMTLEMYGGSVVASVFTPSGTINTSAAPIGSSATNTTQTLASYSLPANTLDAVGRQLEIMSWGRTANNAAPKNLRMAFGGAGFQSGTQTGAAYSWSITGLVLKNAASQQNIRFSGTASGGAITLSSSTDTSVDTGAITISLTCADASAAQSNIFLDGFTVRYFR